MIGLGCAPVPDSPGLSLRWTPVWSWGTWSMLGLGVWVGRRGFQPSREMYECHHPRPPNHLRTCLPSVRSYYKVGVKPREFRKTFGMFGSFIYDIDGEHMRFVIKMLALMAWHLGERTLHLPKTEISQSLQCRKHTKNLDRDFLLFCLPTTT